jgi:hypothetical protein
MKRYRPTMGEYPSVDLAREAILETARSDRFPVERLIGLVHVTPTRVRTAVLLRSEATRLSGERIPRDPPGTLRISVDGTVELHQMRCSNVLQ